METEVRPVSIRLGKVVEVGPRAAPERRTRGSAIEQTGVHDGSSGGEALTAHDGCIIHKVPTVFRPYGRESVIYRGCGY